MTYDSIELAHRAAAGDAAALDLLLTLHLPAVRAFVRLHMGPDLRARESMSDIVQSVCRELLTHKERFHFGGEGGFKAWLFTAARRKIANRARELEHQKRDVQREVAGLSEGHIAALGGAYARISSPTGAALRREDVERLEAAIDRLTDEQKEVITLAHLVGLSRAEIGAHMGRTEEAVRALLHRAMARLSILLDPAS